MTFARRALIRIDNVLIFMSQKDVTICYVTHKSMFLVHRVATSNRSQSGFYMAFNSFGISSSKLVATVPLSCWDKKLCGIGIGLCAITNMSKTEKDTVLKLPNLSFPCFETIYILIRCQNTAVVEDKKLWIVEHEHCKSTLYSFFFPQTCLLLMSLRSH